MTTITPQGKTKTFSIPIQTMRYERGIISYSITYKLTISTPRRFKDLGGFNIGGLSIFEWFKWILDNKLILDVTDPNTETKIQSDEFSLFYPDLTLMVENDDFDYIAHYLFEILQSLNEDPEIEISQLSYIFSETK